MAAIVAIIGVGLFTATSAQASPAIAIKSATALVTTVVSSGGSATIALGTIPAGATNVTLAFTGTGQWQNTVLSATLGSNGYKTVVLNAVANQTSTSTVRLQFPSTPDGKLTLFSSAASINVATSLVGFTVPAPAPTPTPAPVVVPAVAVMPGASNTGVPVGTALTVRSGDLVLSTPGQVVSGLDIRGMVKIAAPNVTIKNSIIRGRTLTGPTALVNNMGNFANLNIVDTEMFPSEASPNVQGFYGSNATFTRVNMHGIIDGVHITGDNVSIQKSWIHDNLHYLVDPNQGGTPSHDDTIQIQIGNNIVINGNTLTGSHSAGVMITQDRGHVSNVTFTNNFADNGACTINIAQKTFGPIVGMTITDNTFGRNTRLLNCAVIAAPTNVINLARNYYTPDNTLVTIKKGS